MQDCTGSPCLASQSDRVLGLITVRRGRNKKEKIHTVVLYTKSIFEGAYPHLSM